jgi:uncharacterized protein involved in outer membrane biogenesis
LKRLSDIYRRMMGPRARRIGLGLLIFFVLFTIIGFFVAPPILKSVLTTQLSAALHRTVAIGSISFNPYTLSVKTRGLKISERKGAGTFVTCDEIFLNLESFSIFRLAPVLKEVRLTKPYARIVRNKDLTYNFSDLIPKSDPNKPTPKFSLNNITIKDGSIDFLDEPKATNHTIKELRVGFPFLSSMPSHVERFVQPLFSARIDGALYTIQGKTKPFADSRETFVEVNVKGIDVPYYLAYVPIKTNIRLTSGYIDIAAKVSFVETKKKAPSLTVSGNVSLRELAAEDGASKPFVRLPLVDVAIAPSEPLSGIVHLSKVTVQSPEFEITRDRKGILNAQSILPPGSEPKPAPQKGGNGPSLSLDIDQIRLTGGKVLFSDLSTGTPFKTVLDPFDVQVDHFSNVRDKKSAYALSVTTEAKETVKMDGQFSVSPLWSEGTVHVASVSLKKYSPFYKDSILFSIEDGRLDLSTAYRYAEGQKEPEIGLSGMSLALSALRLKKTDEGGESGDIVRIPSLSLAQTNLDITKRTLGVGSLSTEKGEVVVKRAKDGQLNLMNLIRPTSAPEEPHGEAKTGRKLVEPARPWTVTLGQVLADKYTIRTEDRTTPRPVKLTVQNLRVQGSDISTAKNARGKIAVSLLLDKKGSFSTSGTIGLTPLSGNLAVSLRNVSVVPFQPYLSERVRMTLTGGAFSTKGNLTFGPGRQGKMNTAYKGEAALAGFSSLDRSSGADLIKFESLSLNGLSLNLSPFSVGIKGVSLSDYYALIMVGQEGRINLQDALAGGEPGAEAPREPVAHPAATTPSKGASPKSDVRIDQVTLQGGRIDFVDKTVKPQFSASLSEMGGRVSGLSAEQNTTADVELRAKLNEYAPLEITGRINPLREDLFVDLKARIKDLDLSPATPYSGKYAGYTIEKGKLSYEAKYSIEKGKLDSQNSVFIDQFSFGDRVESPDATKLPVRLAVALLKDRRGEIKLELPVTGSLDDPKFSVWGIVLKIVVNLIAKAATSPFALLGAAFGGGEELSYTEFDYGRADISEQAMKKLETVAKALRDRPSLKMDIEGHVDVERDRDGLKRFLFERKVKAQKLKEMTRRGEPAVPVDDIKIEPATYERFLKSAYKQEKFPKPKNFVGLAKDLPVPEMEKLMLTHTEVTEGDLRALASRRAMNVKEAILKSGHIEPERLFVLEPKSLAPESKGKVRESRVDFKLK